MQFQLYSESTKCLVPLLPGVIEEGHTIGNLQYYTEGQTQGHDSETENQLEGQIKGQPVTQAKDEACYSEHQTKSQMEGQTDKLISRLSSILQYHLSALYWEIRDTTLEFLTTVLKTHTGILESFCHKILLTLHRCLTIIPISKFYKVIARCLPYNILISLDLFIAILSINKKPRKFAVFV